MIVHGNLLSISGGFILLTFLIRVLSIPTGWYVSKTGNRVIAIVVRSNVVL